MGTLRKVLPDGAVRDLDVLIQQGPAFSPRGMENWDEWSWQEELRFVAGDPTFYDPAEQEVVWAIQELGGLYFFDAAYPDNLFSPWSFGSDVVTGQRQVHYAGTWMAYPTIYFTGPLNHPIIYNFSTSEKIELNYNIAAGEQVVVSLPFGDKTVVNHASLNLMGAVTDDSDLATFHLAPEPEAAWCGTVSHGRPCGLNVINVEGSAGMAGQTEIRMTFKTRYIGV
jgi:hypothetical protein